MATVRMSERSVPPPTSTLPNLPILKTRKSPSGVPTTSTTSRFASMSQTPVKLALRTPSRLVRPALAPENLQTSSTPEVPTLRSSSMSPEQDLGSPGKEVRRSISIAAFPQPPKIGRRIATDAKSLRYAPSPMLEQNKRGSAESTESGRPTSSSRAKKPRTPPDSLGRSFAASASLSLINGNGDGRSITGAPGTRGSDGVVSVASPSHSRSSSAQGSCSTSATTFDDVDESARRGRAEADDSANDGKRQSASNEGKGNVLVSVRVRPDAAASGDKKSDGEWMVDGRKSLVAYKGREGGNYYYDNVFAPHDKNHKVYDTCAKRLVRRVMEGYHGTVFAYGMTGTGKTFSMQGTTNSPGVIPLAITDIFSYIRETPHREFLLRVSYLEIYNERINDLLSPPAVGGIGPGASQPEEIKLREDSKRGVYASPLKEEIVQSPTQLLRVIARGDHSRRTRSTQFNAQSSRSHAVVQIVVESRERSSLSGTAGEIKRAPMMPGGVRVSTLSMIDLAGSERAADNKERRTEGAHINKSLLTLGTVIARLSGHKDNNGNPMDKDGKHLPYRDSKLTRLLQPALSGDSLVSILCTIQIGSTGSVAAANGHTGETLNTLKFAARAKNNIVSHAKKAEEAIGTGSDASRGLLERYRMEIATLRSQLETQNTTQVENEEKKLEKEAEQRHGEQMLEMQLARTALKERIEHLNRLILSSKSTGVNTNGKLSSLSMHPKLESASRSLRSSASHSTLGAVDSSKARTISIGSTVTIGGQANNAQSPSSSFENEGEEEDSAGEFGDGTATSNAQIRSLQADLTDKNRYIATLEKRLLQARRSSQSRTSLAISPMSSKISSILGEDASVTNLLQEKDAEIAELRAKLDDKDRMLQALRSAARKRDVADFSPDSRTGTPLATRAESQHQPHSSNGSVGPFPIPVSPVQLLSPQKDKDGIRRGTDEVQKMIDEMIQGRVESGQSIKNSKGVVRVVSERKKESLYGVPRIGALAATLRRTSTLSEAEPPPP